MTVLQQNPSDCARWFAVGAGEQFHLVTCFPRENDESQESWLAAHVVHAADGFARHKLGRSFCRLSTRQLLWPHETKWPGPHPWRPSLGKHTPTLPLSLGGIARLCLLSIWGSSSDPHFQPVSLLFCSPLLFSSPSPFLPLFLYFFLHLLYLLSFHLCLPLPSLLSISLISLIDLPDSFWTDASLSKFSAVDFGSCPQCPVLCPTTYLTLGPHWCFVTQMYHSLWEVRVF